MWETFRNYSALFLAYVRINLNAQLEYRGAFFSEAIAMLLNDGFWVIFWVLFFARFPVLRGWEVNDVLTLWAVTTAGFGIAFASMGNAWHLAAIIANGQLDMWMLHPRALLTHVLLGRTIATAWGDALFGYLVYIAVVRPDAQRFVMFIVLTLMVAVMFVAFGVLSASLTFYLGNGTLLAEQWRFALINFSTYPETLFTGLVKVVLFTVIPAGFISYLPVRALRGLSLSYLALTFCGVVVMAAASYGAFHRGLRRYESGNLISMNG